MNEETIVEDDHFFDIELAQQYVKKHIIDTGMVRSIVQYTDEGEVEIQNLNYVAPDYVSIPSAKKAENYRKNKNSDV